MNYDGLLVAAVADELNRRIGGGQVQKIRQHNATDVTLEIRAPGHTYLLFMSVDPRFSRIYLTASHAPVPQEPPNFCMVCRKYLEGGFVTAIEQVGFDRILKIAVEHREHGKLFLILEIMGKHGNLILVDSEWKILGAAKHVGSSVSRYRQVLPGRDYLPPPGGDKIDPRSIDPAEFDRLWNLSYLASGRKPPTIASDREAAEAAGRTISGGDADEATVRAWLMETFSGFGPFLADEIVARSSREATVDGDALRDELLRLAEMMRNSAFEPVFITGERGESLMVYPMPSVRFPPSQQHSRASICEALDALFRTFVSRTRLDDEKAQTLTAIRRAIAARKQTLKSIDRTIAESEKADGYRQIGELLLGSLHAFEKGAKSARLVDYFDPNMPEIEVELDEKLAPRENAERYFRRYQKARDAESTARSRRDQTIKEIGALEASLAQADSADSVESLLDLRKTLTRNGLLRAEVARERREDEFGGQRIRRVQAGGWEILYGENSRANDYLTQRVARPNDVWLHARSIVGAHVVIRTAGRSEQVPREVLHHAAKIAALNSDAKHSSLVPIDYTPRKYVRKPRGAAPGFVTYRNEKTIDISPSG